MTRRCHQKESILVQIKRMVDAYRALGIKEPSEVRMDYITYCKLVDFANAVQPYYEVGAVEEAAGLKVVVTVGEGEEIEVL